MSTPDDSQFIVTAAMTSTGSLTVTPSPTSILVKLRGLILQMPKASAAELAARIQDALADDYHCPMCAEVAAK